LSFCLRLACCVGIRTGWAPRSEATSTDQMKRRLTKQHGSTGPPRTDRDAPARPGHRACGCARPRWWRQLGSERRAGRRFLVRFRESTGFAK